MSGLGKIIGALLGLSYGGAWGALFGLYIGHIVDGLALERGGQEDIARARQVFFDTLFSVMGHLAKADGHVSTLEIRKAEQIMLRMRLGARQRRIAIQRFDEGKSTGFDVDGAVTHFRAAAGRHADLTRLFIELLFDAALADGEICAAERKLLQRVARGLGISPAQLIVIETMRRAASGFQGDRFRDDSRNWSNTGAVPPSSKKNPYAVLGLNNGASNAEIKRAYRREIGRHHPDKLVSKGLPKEMLVLAEEKTREIRAAYEALRSERNFR